MIERALLAPYEVNAPARVRARISARLDELGMTARFFASKFAKGDGWINGILTGRNALRLEHLDHAADILKLSPGDLVRRGDEAWDLRPSETRLVRALRFLPLSLQDHLIELTEYLVGVTPDEVELLKRLRGLEPDDRLRLYHGLDLLELKRTSAPRTRATLGLPEMPVETTAASRPHRKR